jgi:hypothetical protein
MYLAVPGISLARKGEEQYQCDTPVSINGLRPGDLVFFVSLSQRVMNVSAFTCPPRGSQFYLIGVKPERCSAHFLRS